MTNTSCPTQFLAVDGANLAYDVTGRGPAVLLLHAGLGDRTMWDAQVPALADAFTVIRLDARGFGETRKPPVVYSPVDDALAVLDHLGFKQAHVVGVSMGSQTAIELAVIAPARVASLVAVAARAASALSRGDHLARWGGEEFAVLARIPLDQPLALAERIRATIADSPFDSVGKVSASFGVTAVHASDTPQAAFERADQALYRAKESGRDRVVLA